MVYYNCLRLRQKEERHLLLSLYYAQYYSFFNVETKGGKACTSVSLIPFLLCFCLHFICFLIFVVDCKPWHSIFWWPSAVKIEGGKFCCTMPWVSQGHVVKWLFFITLIHVNDAGKNIAPWKNVIISVFVLFLRMVTFIFDTFIKGTRRILLLFAFINSVSILLNLLFGIVLIVFFNFGVFVIFFTCFIITPDFFTILLGWKPFLMGGKK